MTDKLLKLRTQERLLILASNYGEDASGVVNPMELGRLLDYQEALAGFDFHAAAKLALEGGRRILELETQLSTVKKAADEMANVASGIVGMMNSLDTYREATKDIQ